MEIFLAFLNRNFFETLSVIRNSSPFWVGDLQSPKATFTTRYVQTYLTFLLVPPNKWCLPQFTVVPLDIWSGKSLSSSTWQPGKSRTKWSHEPEAEVCLQFGCTLCTQTCRQCPWTSSWTDREKKKKACRFTTSYMNEPPENQAGVQLFPVGLNFNSANTRDSTAHLLVMAVLVHMNALRGPGWPDELPSTKILAEVFLIKTVNTSTGSCSAVLLHRLRPIMTKSLGKPSILATSKHPSLL